MKEKPSQVNELLRNEAAALPFGSIQMSADGPRAHGAGLVVVEDCTFGPGSANHFLDSRNVLLRRNTYESEEPVVVADHVGNFTAHDELRIRPSEIARYLRSTSTTKGKP